MEIFYSKTEFGDTLLTNAIRYFDIDAVKSVYNEYKYLLNQPTKLGCTPLFVAIHLKQYEIARFLLEEKADITIKNNNDNTIFDTLKWKIRETFKLFNKLEHTEEETLVNDIFTKYGYSYEGSWADKYRIWLDERFERTKLIDEYAILHKNIKDLKTQFEKLLIKK